MKGIGSLQFGCVWVLALLWVVPVAAAWFHMAARRSEQALDRFASRAMRLRLAPAQSRVRAHVQAGLILGGLALVIVALARPRWGEAEQRVLRRGRDLVIALDVSRSMLAADVRPSRLERAKTDLLDLLGSLRGDRVALLVFRHKSALVCPLTTDYAFVRQALDAARPDSAAPGETDLGDAISKALAAFESADSSHKAIVLITDGEDLAGRADAAAAEAAKRGIPVFAVGFGSTEGSRIPGAEEGTFVTEGGQDVTTRLHHDTLSAIAVKTGGAYVPVGTARADLGAIYANHLRRLAARDIEETVERRYIERFQLFLVPGVLLWMAAAGLSRGRLRSDRPRVPRVPAAGVVAVLALSLAMEAAGQAVSGAVARAGADPEGAMPRAAVPAGRSGARLAQGLARSGRYAEAAEAYLQAGRDATASSRALFTYNAACAWLRAGEFARAAQLFRGLAADPGADGLPVAYNLGCALLAQGEAMAGSETNSAAARGRAAVYREAARAFHGAIRPPFEDEARRNIDLAAAAALEAEARSKAMAVAEKYGGMDEGRLAQSMLDAQRDVADGAPSVAGEAVPARIARHESLARRQGEALDMLGPFAERFLAAVGSQDQQAAAAAGRHVEALRSAMADSRARLEDLDPAAAEAARRAELGIYQAWKAVAPYDLVLREDLARQSNAMAAAGAAAADKDRTAYLARALQEQREAAFLTGVFSNRFAAAFPEGAAAEAPAAVPGAAGTNAPAGGMTPETRRKIMDLSAQAVRMQTDAAAAVQEQDFASSAELQRSSEEALREIERLLPRQQQPQPQPQPQEQQDESPQNDESKEQPQPQDQPQDRQDQGSEQQQQEPEAEQQPRDENQMSPEKAEELLRRALEREKEHEDDLRRRSYLQLVPDARDW